MVKIDIAVNKAPFKRFLIIGQIDRDLSDTIKH